VRIIAGNSSFCLSKLGRFSRSLCFESSLVDITQVSDVVEMVREQEISAFAHFVQKFFREIPTVISPEGDGSIPLQCAPAVCFCSGSVLNALWVHCLQSDHVRALQHFQPSRSSAR